ncbi:hypothetical protein COO60DRAFT_632353 [Scenedesmus sp. NREL 46B-D3]|nr:hypothetical protein COO60DRAFT_632353 [Scenedesmus sp. NREL 46B-D3]
MLLLLLLLVQTAAGFRRFQRSCSLPMLTGPLVLAMGTSCSSRQCTLPWLVARGLPNSWSPSLLSSCLQARLVLQLQLSIQQVQVDRMQRPHQHLRKHNLANLQRHTPCCCCCCRGSLCAVPASWSLTGAVGGRVCMRRRHQRVHPHLAVQPRHVVKRLGEAQLRALTDRGWAAEHCQELAGGGHLRPHPHVLREVPSCLHGWQLQGVALGVDGVQLAVWRGREQRGLAGRGAHGCAQGELQRGRRLRA